MALGRISLVASALLASACASNATAPQQPLTGNPQIEFRGAKPVARASAPVKPQSQASRGTQSAPVPPPRVVDMGASSSSPAVV
jgi:hypothetical protein